jgi:hypothetical protein
MIDASGTVLLIGAGLGMALALVGSFLPIIDYEGEKVGGWDDGGLELGVQALAAMAAIVGYVMTPAANRWLLGVVFVLAIVLLAQSGSYVARIDADAVGTGLWLMVAGSMLATVAAVLAFVIAQALIRSTAPKPENDLTTEE